MYHTLNQILQEKRKRSIGAAKCVGLTTTFDSGARYISYTISSFRRKIVETEADRYEKTIEDHIYRAVLTYL